MLSVKMRMTNGMLVTFEWATEDYVVNTVKNFEMHLNSMWSNNNGFLMLIRDDGSATLVNLRTVSTMEIVKVEL